MGRSLIKSIRPTRLFRIRGAGVGRSRVATGQELAIFSSLFVRLLWHQRLHPLPELVGDLIDRFKLQKRTKGEFPFSNPANRVSPYGEADGCCECWVVDFVDHTRDARWDSKRTWQSKN